MSRQRSYYWKDKFNTDEQEIGFVNSIKRINGDCAWEVYVHKNWLSEAIVSTNYLEFIDLDKDRILAMFQTGKVERIFEDHLVRDFIEAYNYIPRLDGYRLSVEGILYLHGIMFKGTNNRIAGYFKACDNYVKEGNLFASYKRVPEYMCSLVSWYNNAVGSFDVMTNFEVLQVLAKFKQEFVNIHPFEDGNGRMSRLLVQSALIKLGLPPILFNKSKRAKYHEIMSSGYTRDIMGSSNGMLVGYLVREFMGVIG